MTKIKNNMSISFIDDMSYQEALEKLTKEKKNKSVIIFEDGKIYKIKSKEFLEYKLDKNGKILRDTDGNIIYIKNFNIINTQYTCFKNVNTDPIKISDISVYLDFKDGELTFNKN